MRGCNDCRDYFTAFHRGHQPTCRLCPYFGRETLTIADPLLIQAVRLYELIADGFGVLRWEVIGGILHLPARLVAAMLILKRGGK